MREVRAVSKRFAGVLALDRVDLVLHPGEVLAVIGENGAGKSTLMKILAGVQPADTGELLVDGQPVQIDGVEEALAAGIALIHQELNLADNLDIAANIFLGREPRRGPAGVLIDHARTHGQSRRFLDMVGLAVDPATGTTRLVVSETQDTWQRNRPEMRFLQDGQRFLWETEKSGWKHWELRDLGGTLINTLTSGEFPVESIVKLDEEAGRLYFTANSSETKKSYLYRLHNQILFF